MKKFRIIEVKEMIVYSNGVEKGTMYLIQEFKRGFFGLGRKKWRHFKAESRGYGGDSCNEVSWFFHDELPKAKEYIQDLRKFYNKKSNPWYDHTIQGEETSH